MSSEQFYIFIRLLGVLAPSLRRESTNSRIPQKYIIVEKLTQQNQHNRKCQKYDSSKELYTM